MEILTAFAELAVAVTVWFGRLVLWAIFSPSHIAWPVALSLAASLAVLGYRPYPDHSAMGIGLGIAALAVVPARLYLTRLQKPRPTKRTVQSSRDGDSQSPLSRGVAADF